jgi:hypothetical protein
MNPTTIGKKASQRFSGPWTPNPWIIWPTVGPRNSQSLDGGPRASDVSLFASPREPTAAMIDVSASEEQRRALSAWEYEGGKTKRIVAGTVPVSISH